MFEDTTVKLVENIGDSELRPVTCLLHATKIHPFSLIWRNKCRSSFWEPPEAPLDVSLMHILEPGASVPGNVSRARAAKQGSREKGCSPQDTLRHPHRLTSGWSCLQGQRGGTRVIGELTGYEPGSISAESSLLNQEYDPILHESL